MSKGFLITLENNDQYWLDEIGLYELFKKLASDKNLLKLYESIIADKNKTIASLIAKVKTLKKKRRSSAKRLYDKHINIGNVTKHKINGPGIYTARVRFIPRKGYDLTFNNHRLSINRRWIAFYANSIQEAWSFLNKEEVFNLGWRCPLDSPNAYAPHLYFISSTLSHNKELLSRSFF